MYNACMKNEQVHVEEFYARDATIYDAQTRLIRHLFGIEKERRRLVCRAYGNVLDLPASTGLNFPFFSDDCSVIAADFSEEMLELAKQKAEKLGRDIAFVQADAEQLPFEDNQFDTVTSMLGLCTYPDPVQAISEIQRVCKPGGQLLFLDHGLSSIGCVASIQNHFNERHVRKHACHLNRDPVKLFRKAGVAIDELRRSWLGSISSIVVQK